MKTNGFTLAEVLLTLAIIGVVAALTIPAVITKVTQDQYVVGLKKAYNTLKAVEREAVQANGDMKNWDWNKNLSQTFETYFKPHFDILKDCGATTDNGCFADNNQLYGLDNKPWTPSFNSANYYKIITSDGIAYGYFNSYNNPSSSPIEFKGTFVVDINSTKKPNILGRDIFFFRVFPNIGIKPNGLYENEETIIQTSEINSNCSALTGIGAYCAAKVLAEGAMNY